MRHRMLRHGGFIASDGALVPVWVVVSTRPYVPPARGRRNPALTSARRADALADALTSQRRCTCSSVRRRPGIAVYSSRNRRSNATMLMPEREAKSGPRRRLTHRASSQRNCACLMTTPVGPDFSVEVTFQNETFADTRTIRLRLNEIICRRGILSVGKGAPRCSVLVFFHEPASRPGFFYQPIGAPPSCGSVVAMGRRTPTLKQRGQREANPGLPFGKTRTSSSGRTPDERGLLN